MIAELAALGVQGYFHNNFSSGTLYIAEHFFSFVRQQSEKSLAFRQKSILESIVESQIFFIQSIIDMIFAVQFYFRHQLLLG